MKYSRQRESIINYLDTHRTHPTAETVYLDLKKEYPTISLATVYRNLNLLAEHGDILRISSSNGPDRFDGNSEPHYHFICNQCGCVLDLDFSSSIPLDELANANFAGEITSHVTYFFGRCPECSRSTKN